jgi:hypothetical protein
MWVSSLTGPLTTSEDQPSFSVHRGTGCRTVRTRPATPAAAVNAPDDRILDPISRLSEIMFGLLMALTFTGTMSVVIGAGGDVRSVLVAALGCNLAWGIVDGTMHVLTTVTGRGRDIARNRLIRHAAPDEARRLVREGLPDGAGSIMTDDEIDRIREWLWRLPDDAKPASITSVDLRAAGLVFLLVVSATLPPAVPFILFDDVHLAMRVSNLIALVMLFWIGRQFDRQMNRTALPMRIVVPVIGCLLVALTIALGG